MHRLHHEPEQLRRILQQVRGYDLPGRDVPQGEQAAQEQEGQGDAQEVQAGHLRREHTRLPDHRQILQDGRGHQYKVQPSLQELHLPYGQRGGQIDSAQEEPALRTGGDASMQIVVQGEEASLQRELRIRNRGGGGRDDNAEQQHESPRQPDQEELRA